MGVFDRPKEWLPTPIIGLNFPDHVIPVLPEAPISFDKLDYSPPWDDPGADIMGDILRAHQRIRRPDPSQVIPILPNWDMLTNDMLGDTGTDVGFDVKSLMEDVKALKEPAPVESLRSRKRRTARQVADRG